MISVCLFRLMSQRYGNLFFLRKFFRIYFRCFFVFPVFAGVTGQKKEGPKPPFHQTMLPTKKSIRSLIAELSCSAQCAALSDTKVKETVNVQCNLCR